MGLFTSSNASAKALDPFRRLLLCLRYCMDVQILVSKLFTEHFACQRCARMMTTMDFLNLHRGFHALLMLFVLLRLLVLPPCEGLPAGLLNLCCSLRLLLLTLDLHLPL